MHAKAYGILWAFLITKSNIDIFLCFSLDIAVGAPFEDDHRGAVYIYNGRSGNFDKPWTFSQRITSNDIGLGISALGYYLSKSQVDIDDNLYGGI